MTSEEKKAKLDDFRSWLAASPVSNRHADQLRYVEYEAKLDLIEAVQSLPGYNDVQQVVQLLTWCNDTLTAIHANTRKP